MSEDRTKKARKPISGVSLASFLLLFVCALFPDITAAAECDYL